MLALGWGIAIILLPFVLLLFPTGRLPSRRWRFLAWVLVAVGAIMLPLGSFSSESGQGPVKNPFAVERRRWGGDLRRRPRRRHDLFSSIILSAFSLVVRYHRASGVERQQLKRFALAAVLFGGHIVADLLRFIELLGDDAVELLDVATSAGLYVAVGIAILRYRLYDIDVIINRTLVYGA